MEKGGSQYKSHTDKVIKWRQEHFHIFSWTTNNGKNNHKYKFHPWESGPKEFGHLVTTKGFTDVCRDKHTDSLQARTCSSYQEFVKAAKSDRLSYVSTQKLSTTKKGSDIKFDIKLWRSATSPGKDELRTPDDWLSPLTHFSKTLFLLGRRGPVRWRNWTKKKRERISYLGQVIDFMWEEWDATTLESV